MDCFIHIRHLFGCGTQVGVSRAREGKGRMYAPCNGYREVTKCRGTGCEIKELNLGQFHQKNARGSGMVR